MGTSNTNSNGTYINNLMTTDPTKPKQSGTGQQETNGQIFGKDTQIYTANGQQTDDPNVTLPSGGGDPITAHRTGPTDDNNVTLPTGGGDPQTQYPTDQPPQATTPTNANNNQQPTDDPNVTLPSGGGDPRDHVNGQGGTSDQDQSGDITPIPNQSRLPETQALINQLMARAGQSLDVSNDPVVKAQTDAFAAQQERARRDYLSQQAEAASPYSSGQLANATRMTAEQMGQSVGQFQGDLMGKELSARRDEIQNALGQLGNTLSDEEKNGLQRELGNLNAAIEKAKLGTQNQQFYAGLNQQDKQFVSTLSQNERFKNMDDALARYNTATQNAQFMSKLAQDGDLAKLQLNLDQQKISNQDKQFLLQLAQDGKFKDLESEYKRLALSQDQNQFMAKLAQEGNIAQMDDVFRRMQLAQQESQFLDKMGFDVTDRRNYWDWLQRGNAPPNP